MPTLQFLATISALEKQLTQVKEERDKAVKRENEFWEYLRNAFLIESREELEEHAKGWSPQNSLLVALHHIWKREPKVEEIQKQLTQVRRERDRAESLMNNPEINNFIEGVKSEAAHQVKRWGKNHDGLKTPEDWLWLIAYLSTKASQASRYGDKEKYLHHILTCAAACFNWHKNVTDTPEPQPKKIP